MDEPDQYIDFMAKYKDWVAIKKLGIRENTTPQEVAYQLAAIRAAVDRKAFSILGIKTDMLDAHAAQVTKGLRKGYESLSGALSTIKSSEGKKVINESCDNKDLLPLAETYLLAKIMTEIGFNVGIDQLALSKIYKELKPPKAPGRMGKGKKKETEG